jgi:predicted nucleic acid-binding protein
MLVVDTNIVAYLYLDPHYLSQLQAVLDRDQEWIAPSLWRSELRSVLLLYLRQGSIGMDRAIKVMGAAESLLGTIDYFPISSHVLALALASGCSAYDCEFVALARDMGTVLITYDRKLLAAFPTVALTPTTYLASTTG